jgi:D-alanyl-D-alanine carboxypeptidase (penicillin-binding protein 5/6)
VIADERRQVPRRTALAQIASSLILPGLVMPAYAQKAATPRLASFGGTSPIVLLRDMASGATLFARAPDQRFIPASIVKLMTAYVTLNAVKAGRLALDQGITVPAALVTRWRQWPRASSMRLRSGESVTVAALLDGMITASGNDAAELLAATVGGDNAAFAARMNRMADQLGMKDCHFTNPTGWPDGGKTQVTAAGMARLAERLIRDHPAAYARFFGNRSLTRPDGSRLANRNPLLGTVAGVDGLKTGHISSAGYTLVGSARRGETRLIAVLAGAQSPRQRAGEAAALLEAGFAAMTAAGSKARP